MTRAIATPTTITRTTTLYMQTTLAKVSKIQHNKTKQRNETNSLITQAKPFKNKTKRNKNEKVLN